MLIVLLCGFIVVVFASFVGAPLSPVDGIAASLIVVTMIWTAFHYLQSDYRAIPFLPYALLHLSVFFAVPVFWPTVTIRAWPSHQPYYSYALLLVLLCAAAIILGHSFALKFWKQRAAAVANFLPDVSERTMRAPLLIFAFTLVAVATRSASTLAIGTEKLGPLAYVLQTILDPYFLFSILMYCYYAKDVNCHRAIIVVSFLMLVVYGAFLGQIHALVKPFAIVFLARLIFRKKFTWSFVALVIVGFIVLNPIKNDYRNFLRTANDFTVSQVFDAWQRAWSEDDRVSSNPITYATQARLNELVYVANAVENIPAEVDYQLGYPWRTIFIVYIPRILWKDKPDLRRVYSTEWAVQMGYMEPAQHKWLAVNLPLPVDGFWNFGIFGVVLVGLIFGGVIGFLENLSKTKNCMTFALGMTMFVSIHANNRLGTTLADLPLSIFLLCMLVIGLNLLNSIPAVIRYPRASNA